MRVFHSLKRRLSGLLRARLGWRDYYYGKFDRASRDEVVADRSRDVAQVVDLQPEDSMLDMGCAEGLISLEAAKRVAHVHGVEISPARIEWAKREAAKQGVATVSFETGSVCDYPLEPSYDVVFAAPTRLGLVPPLVVVPTEQLSGHPCLRRARLGPLSDVA